MIKNMNILQQSAFFAKLSNTAYKNLAFMRTEYPDYQIIYHNNNGADTYTLEDSKTLIVVCRGTEVKQVSDVKADLSISKTHTDHGKLHIGFNHYVDKIWDSISSRGFNAYDKNKEVWFTGHSLGAAMATIMAYRFSIWDSTPIPQGLFTYGSPRVGDRQFINYFNKLPFPHHRWVNDGDIITKIPLAPFFYHCGTMHHIDSSGIPTLNYEHAVNPFWLLKLISPKAMLNMLLGDTKDHSSDKYKIFLLGAANS